MASNYWLKLYHEMLDDPKVMTLRPALRWRFIECLLVAGEMEQDGLLPATDHYAWRVRANPEVVETELAELADAGLLSRDDGKWLVAKFAERQEADSPAERMRRMRERRRKQEYYEPDTQSERDSYEPVTKRNTDKIREDRDREEIRRARVLTAAYCEIVSAPEPDLDHRAAGAAWIDPACAIWKMAGDEEQAIDLVRATIAYMDREALSYKNLSSLVNTARTVYKQANGHVNGTGGDASAIWSNFLLPYRRGDVPFGNLPDNVQQIVRELGESNVKDRPTGDIRAAFYTHMKAVTT